METLETREAQLCQKMLEIKVTGQKSAKIATTIGLFLSVASLVLVALGVISWPIFALCCFGSVIVASSVFMAVERWIYWDRYLDRVCELRALYRSNAGYREALERLKQHKPRLGARICRMKAVVGEDCFD